MHAKMFLFCQKTAILLVSACWICSAVLAADSPLAKPGNDSPDSPAENATPEEATQQQTPEDVDKKIRQRIEQLGHSDYFVRERAQEELAKYSFEAFDALNIAAGSRDLEIATRAKYLLRLMRVEWTTKDDPESVKQLLSKYEVQSNKDKVARMKLLAALPGGVGTPALCRLIRYEKSPILARNAALELIDLKPVDEKVAATLRKHLKGSQRPPAHWVITYLQLGQDDEKLMAEWEKLVEAERKLFSDSPGRTNRQIVAEMLRQQIAWLKEARQNERAVAVTRKLIDLEDGDQKRLTELLTWLVEQEAWRVVDELYAKFKPQFQSNSSLLYALAEARLAEGKEADADTLAAKALKLDSTGNSRDLQKHLTAAAGLYLRKRYRWAANEYRYVVGRKGGDSSTLAFLTYCLLELEAWKEIDDLAGRYPLFFGREAFLLYSLAEAQLNLGRKEDSDKTADRAKRLNPGKDPEKLVGHLTTAYRLQSHGLFRWAKMEFDHAIQNSGIKHGIGIAAQSWLAEMQHDQGDDAAAAATLKKLCDAFGDDAPDDTNVSTNELDIDRELGELRSRMYFFFACDALKKNQPDKQREYLDKATAIEPVDLDALIACHELPDKTPEYCEKLQKLINKSADQLREEMRKEPKEASGYNQLAWLIGNTAGDLDEALKCAKIAIGMKPTSGGYLDTLAHVHFARGEYEKAVEVQTKAAGLENHSGLIQRKLDLFKKKLEEEKRKERIKDRVLPK